MDIQFWMHKDGWLYTGDQIEGARVATGEEIEQHQEMNLPSDAPLVVSDRGSQNAEKEQ